MRIAIAIAIAIARLAIATLLVAGCGASRGQIVLAGAGAVVAGAVMMGTAPEDGSTGAGWGPAGVHAQGPFGAVVTVGGAMVMIAGAGMPRPVTP
jgi:hypothetical protein